MRYKEYLSTFVHLIKYKSQEYHLWAFLALEWPFALIWESQSLWYQWFLKEKKLFKK